MTTIAYKNGIMASDSRATYGSKIVRGSLEKIWRTKGALVGLVGDADEHCRWQESFFSLKSPYELNDWIVDLEKEDRDWGFIAVFQDDPSRVYIGDITCDGDTSKSGFYHTELGPNEGIARGSGSPWAEAIMYNSDVGPVEAVYFAMNFDSATGGDVVEYVLLP